MRVGIVGQGYVGLALSSAICAIGQPVIGFDVDIAKVSDFKAGRFPVDFREAFALREALKKELYEVSVDAAALSKCEVVIIAVPTPLDSKGLPDTSILEGACEEIAKYLRVDALVISESTSHPGTLRNLIMPAICNVRKDKGKFLEFAIAPERVNPSDHQFSVHNTPRVVAGNTFNAGKRAKEFYIKFVKDVHLVDEPEIAELSKLLENSFRLININFINELASYCHVKNIDIQSVISAAATKPFGFMPFYPGAGVGGHCIPVDPAYLLYDSKEVNSKIMSLEIALQGNNERSKIIVDNVIKKFGALTGKNILIEGVSYKPNVDDIREAASLKLANEFVKHGANVFWWDPLVSNFPIGNKTNQYESMDLVIIVVIHSSTEISKIIKLSPLIIDTTYSLPISDKIVRL